MKTALQLTCLSAVLLSGAALASPDSDTLSKLHAGNQKEIQMGTVAKAQGTDSKVKDFGATMVKDHTNMDKDVQTFAKEHQLTLPEPEAAAMDMSSLKSKSGADFDRTFMTLMVADHDQDVSEVKTALELTQDKKMKKLLGRTLDKMEQHKKLADRWMAKHPATP